MRRREFITLLGGAAAVGPLAARAQQAGSRHTVGILSASGAPALNTVFVDALSELGWVEKGKTSFSSTAMRTIGSNGYLNSQRT